MSTYCEECENWKDTVGHLESERDSLREDRDAMEYRINELKAELKIRKWAVDMIAKDRDLWKNRAYDAAVDLSRYEEED